MRVRSLDMTAMFHYLQIAFNSLQLIDPER
jgi:hypothetical protein